MAATAQFTIRAGASCSGEVSSVLTGPATRTVTRLVAGPERRPGPGGPVPRETTPEGIWGGTTLQERRAARRSPARRAGHAAGQRVTRGGTA
jgi:hypothetical protein